MGGTFLYLWGYKIYTMTTSLKLRTATTKLDGTCPVLVRAFMNGQKVDFGTQESLHPKFWDGERNTFKKTRDQEVRDKLARVQKKQVQIQDAMNKLAILRPGFTVKDLRAYLKGELDPTTNVKESFLTWVTDHVENFDKRALRGQTRTGSEATKKKYRTHLEMLLNFSEETGEALTWENMDAEFVKRMKEWRTSKPANFFRKGYKDDTAVAIGTVRRWVKTVRSWITQARALGVHPFDHHLHPEWKVSEGDVLRFALTSQQLRDFFEWEVPADTNGGGERTGIKKVRDLFVLQCSTGVRVGDLEQIIEQYNADPSREQFQVFMQKTQRTVKIPVLPMVHEVAARYDGNIPYPNALSRHNKQLKKAAKMCGLFDKDLHKTVLDTEGKLQVVVVKQYDELTSHAARRTFATIAVVEKGISEGMVMAITGHTSAKEFRKYSVIDPGANAEMFRDAWLKA